MWERLERVIKSYSTACFAFYPPNKWQHCSPVQEGWGQSQSCAVILWMYCFKFCCPDEFYRPLVPQFPILCDLKVIWTVPKCRVYKPVSCSVFPCWLYCAVSPYFSHCLIWGVLLLGLMETVQSGAKPCRKHFWHFSICQVSEQITSI